MPIRDFRPDQKVIMLRLVVIQLATTFFAAIVSGLVAGVHGFISALLGGLCCVVPNGVFALRLYIGSKKPGTISPMTFFFGEFTKIAFTIALLAAVVVGYRDLNWLALIAAFIVALKSYIILLFRH
jgi:ATP synthase protein I